MHDKRADGTSETYEFVPGDPPYVVRRVQLGDGTITAEIRHHDMVNFVKAIYGPRGAIKALDQWVDQVAEAGSESDQHQAAS